MQRGYTKHYDRSSSRWTLEYVDTRSRVLGREEVDLDTFNQRLRRRSVFDHGAGGVDGRGAQAFSTPPDGTLDKLISDISPSWQTALPRYDTHHWMGNWATLLAVDKGTPIHHLWMILTSDALATYLPGGCP